MMLSYLTFGVFVLIFLVTIFIIFKTEKLRITILDNLKPKIKPFLDERREAIKLIRKLQYLPYHQVKKEVEDFLSTLNKENDNIII